MEYKTSIKSDTSLTQMVQIGGDLASWTDTIGKKKCSKTVYVISYPATPNRKRWDSLSRMQGIQKKSLKNTPAKSSSFYIRLWHKTRRATLPRVQFKQVISCQAENLERHHYTQRFPSGCRPTIGTILSREGKYARLHVDHARQETTEECYDSMF